MSVNQDIEQPIDSEPLIAEYKGVRVFPSGISYIKRSV